jgi:hypothetical protein
MRNYRHIHFRASGHEYRELTAIAEEEGTTASAILRRLIHLYLNQRHSRLQHVTATEPGVNARPRQRTA